MKAALRRPHLPGMDIESLQRMLERGQDSALLRLALGNASAKAGRADEAMAHFREAVRRDPDLSAAWQGLARGLVKAGDPSARDVCRQGLAVARQRGDMQVVRVLEVLERRLERP